MGKWIRLALSGLTLLLPTSVLAQRTTGLIAGIVTDETGGALPGVTVAVSGPNIVGPQTTVTSPNGFYHLPNLPPGGYQLSFALAGFKTLLREGVRASVGGTAEENAVLVVSSLAEEIEVRAAAAVVDTSSNQVGTNYERSWIENAPLPRNGFLDVAASAPGTLWGGDTGDRARRLLAYGSSQDENSFLLDGGSITDHNEGLAYVKPNVDTIEEVQVLSLGAPAEYGGASGAVYNVVTRQGTNAFHGEANLYLQTAGLTGNNTGNYPSLANGSFVDSCPSDPTRHCPFRRETYKELTFQLGGPVFRDRLWFFASYQRRLDGYSNVGSEPPEALDHANRTHAYLFKLNYQLNPRHKLQASFHLDDERAPEVGPANWAPTTAGVFEKRTPTPGLSYTGTLSDKSVVELRYSGFFSNRTTGPLDPDQPRDLPAIHNFDTGYHSGGLGHWAEAYWSASTLDAKLSHYSDDFLGGSHEFRFGVQYQVSPNAVNAAAANYISVFDSGEGYRLRDFDLERFRRHARDCCVRGRHVPPERPVVLEPRRAPRAGEGPLARARPGERGGGADGCAHSAAGSLLLDDAVAAAGLQLEAHARRQDGAARPLGSLSPGDIRLRLGRRGRAPHLLLRHPGPGHA